MILQKRRAPRVLTFRFGRKLQEVGLLGLAVVLLAVIAFLAWCMLDELQTLRKTIIQQVHTGAQMFAADDKSATLKRIETFLEVKVRGERFASKRDDSLEDCSE